MCGENNVKISCYIKFSEGSDASLVLLTCEITYTDCDTAAGLIK